MSFQELSIRTYSFIFSFGLQTDQSILKETNPEYSLEEMMLKLKLQYFDHMMLRADSLEKTLGKIFGKDVGKN